MMPENEADTRICCRFEEGTEGRKMTVIRVQRLCPLWAFTDQVNAIEITKSRYL